jgi:hypothetical protein
MLASPRKCADRPTPAFRSNCIAPHGHSRQRFDACIMRAEACNGPFGREAGYLVRAVFVG